MSELTLGAITAVLKDAMNPETVWYEPEADTYAAMCAYVERFRGQRSRIREPEVRRQWEARGIYFHPHTMVSDLNVPRGSIFMLTTDSFADGWERTFGAKRGERQPNPNAWHRWHVDQVQEPHCYSKGSLERDEPRAPINDHERRKRHMDGIARHVEELCERGESWKVARMLMRHAPPRPNDGEEG